MHALRATPDICSCDLPIRALRALKGIVSATENDRRRAEVLREE